MWSNPANWNTVPGASDNVFFKGSFDFDCTGDVVPDNLGSITLEATYTQRLTFNSDFAGGSGMLTIIGSLTVNGGTILCKGDPAAVNAAAGGTPLEPYGRGITRIIFLFFI